MEPELVGLSEKDKSAIFSKTPNGIIAPFGILSLLILIPDICHLDHLYIGGEKNRSCGEISDFNKCQIFHM